MPYEKIRTSHILIILKSVLSEHSFPMIRARGPEKMEIVKFDPHAQKFAVYREQRERKSFKP